jgi:hypothetical protein
MVRVHINYAIPLFMGDDESFGDFIREEIIARKYL